jgi:hypothetical protein
MPGRFGASLNQLSSPAQMTVRRARPDDLVGAIVAHEIGHLIGIRHAVAGLMRANPGRCGRSRLGFNS